MLESRILRRTARRRGLTLFKIIWQRAITLATASTTSAIMTAFMLEYFAIGSYPGTIGDTDFRSESSKWAFVGKRMHTHSRPGTGTDQAPDESEVCIRASWLPRSGEAVTNRSFLRKSRTVSNWPSMRSAQGQTACVKYFHGRQPCSHVSSNER